MPKRPVVHRDDRATYDPGPCPNDCGAQLQVTGWYPVDQHKQGTGEYYSPKRPYCPNCSHAR